MMGLEPTLFLIGSQMPYQLGDIRIFELLPRIELSLFLITSEVHHHSCVRSILEPSPTLEVGTQAYKASVLPLKLQRHLRRKTVTATSRFFLLLTNHCTMWLDTN